MPSRASKEIRTLLLPAGLVLAATVVSALLAAQWSTALRQLGSSIGMSAFFLGTPLLAAWSLGSEFHQRTLVLLLSQPVSRSRVWLEKWITLALIAGMVVAIQSALLPFDEDLSVWARALWFTAMLAATPLWTMVARSTIGGVAFSMGVVAVLEMTAAILMHWVVPGTRIEMFRQAPVVNALRAAYPIAGFLLGWWTFSRLQAGRLGAIGGSAARAPRRLELPLPGYSRTGVLRNLFLTEIHLHRVTWIVAAAWTACWLAALAILAVSRAGTGTVETTFSILMSVYFPIAIVLAGTLSVSEDTTLGVHAWRLTFPLSSRAQWLVKLAGTLLASAVAVVALPLAMMQLIALVFSPVGGFPPVVAPQTVAVVLAIVLLCFWAATVFGHTVRAALAAGALLVTAVIATNVLLRLPHPGGTLQRLMTWLMVRWQLPPDYLATAVEEGFFVVTPLAVSVVALALSLRAFRRVEVGHRTVVRHVALLAAVMLLPGMVAVTFAESAWRQLQSRPVLELRLAAVDATTPAREGPVELTVEDLRPTGRLSPQTERWLAGSTITVERQVWFERTRSREARSVRVRFPGGREFAFWVRVGSR